MKFKRNDLYVCLKEENASKMMMMMMQVKFYFIRVLLLGTCLATQKEIESEKIVCPKAFKIINLCLE